MSKDETKAAKRLEAQIIALSKKHPCIDDYPDYTSWYQASISWLIEAGLRVYRWKDLQPAPDHKISE